MFKLRQAHFDAFQLITDKLLIERIIIHLHENHAEAIDSIPGDLLREMTAYGIRRARLNGLTWEYSITVFVSLMFEVAPNFDERERVRLHLMRPASTPDKQMETLVKSIPDAEWRAAVLSYDESAWFPGRRGE